MQRLLCFICLLTISFSTALALGADKVVVIPLLGGKKLTGDATAADVLKGKTFSNASEIGVTGIRPPAPAEKTGQKKSFIPGDDGDYEKGETWPTPRFSTDSFFIGRTDYTTGLVWGRTLFIPPNNIFTYEWAEALNACESSSSEGADYRIDDWRLPNIKEILTLIDYGNSDPALPDDNPFTGIQTDDVYWTSTTDPSDPTFGAYIISFRNGMVGTGLKVQAGEVPPGSHYALCVRGPFASEDELKPPKIQ